MLGLLFLSESQNLWKNGQPPHSTTGDASTNSTIGYAWMGTPTIGAIASTKSGTLSAALTQKRRVMSRSSVSSPSAAPIGTSAMPHFGQEPGPTCTISGCIGQVYCAPGFTAGAGLAPR